MNTLTLHSGKTERPTVWVEDYPDHPPEYDAFWTINIKTQYLEVRVFFHHLGDVEAFHEELGKGVAALREKAGVDDSVEEEAAALEVIS